jgi:hypothetical protein
MSGTEYSGYFYVQPPKAGEAKFFWYSPLFSVERNKLVLHLGLPDGPSDDEFSKRYHEMGFGGLHKVYLHCARQTSDNIIENLRGIYAHQKLPPAIEVITST